jgi:hypothetical protein
VEFQTAVAQSVRRRGRLQRRRLDPDGYLGIGEKFYSGWSAHRQRQKFRVSRDCLGDGAGGGLRKNLGFGAGGELRKYFSKKNRQGTWKFLPRTPYFVHYPSGPDNAVISFQKNNFSGGLIFMWDVFPSLEYTFKGCSNKTRVDTRIPGGLIFMWDVFPSFRFRISIAASQKKPNFDTLKMKKALFV